MENIWIALTIIFLLVVAAIVVPFVYDQHPVTPYEPPLKPVEILGLYPSELPYTRALVARDNLIVFWDGTRDALNELDNSSINLTLPVSPAIGDSVRIHNPMISNRADEFYDDLIIKSSDGKIYVKILENVAEFVYDGSYWNVTIDGKPEGGV